MPVLIGTKQGEGKSTLVRWLALSDDYFSEVNEFEGQRGIESLEGAWICEVSELLAMTKTKEQEAVKSFLTRLNDRYRIQTVWFAEMVAARARLDGWRWRGNVTIVMMVTHPKKPKNPCGCKENRLCYQVTMLPSFYINIFHQIENTFL